jgi:hypothetical protein
MRLHLPRKFTRIAIAILVLNEIRGIIVVALIVAGWRH